MLIEGDPPEFMPTALVFFEQDENNIRSPAVRIFKNILYDPIYPGATRPADAKGV